MREMMYYEHPLEYKKILDVKKTATLNKSLREGMGSMKPIRASLDMSISFRHNCTSSP